MKDFTSGNEARQIFSFAIPMLFGNLFHQLYNVVDSIIVGRFIGEEALAAVGASFPIVFTLIALVLGIGIGASVVISQYFGAQNYDKVREASDTIHVFLIISSLALSVIGILCSKSIFRLLELPEELVEPASTYLNIFFLGLIFMFGFNGTTAILRGIGDAKTPLYFLVIATLVNIVLDLLFILVFKWGVAGAAWATVLSQAGAYFSAIIYLNRNNHLVRFNPLKVTFNKAIFWQSVRIGLPTGLQQTFVALGGLFMFRFINPFGTNVIAAYSAANRIDSMASLPAMNFSAALSGFVGQNIGANKLHRVRSGLKATLIMSSVACVIMTIGILLCGEEIMSLFTTNKEVVRIGYEYLVIISSFYILFSVLFSFTGVLRGAGDTLIPMFITLISLWVIRIPLAWLLSSYFNLGEQGVWWSIPIGWIFGATGAFLYYKGGKWKNKGVIRYNYTSEYNEHE